MKNSIIKIFSMLIVLGIVISGCSKQSIVYIHLEQKTLIINHNRYLSLINFLFGLLKPHIQCNIR